MRAGERFAVYRREYRRTWRGRLVSLLLLVPVMWLSVLLLRVPAGYALTVPALLMDRAVVASTAVALPVAVLLLVILPVRGARAAAIVGAAVSGIVGLPTAIAALEAPRKTFPTALALASVVGGLTLLTILLRSSIRGRRWSLSFLAPLSLLPLIQFWHSTVYTPAQSTTSVNPNMSVAVQRLDGEERRGIIEVTSSNVGEVRATLFTAELTYCFVTEDMSHLGSWEGHDLGVNENCIVQPVFFRHAQIDAQTTQSWTMQWTYPADRSLAILVMESHYVREDRMQLADTPPSQQERVEGCQGNVTTYRLQPDTRFKGVVQPTRLLTYDQVTFYLTYEGSQLCDPEQDRELMEKLGVRYILVRRNEWLTDDVEQN